MIRNEMTSPCTSPRSSFTRRLPRMRAIGHLVSSFLLVTSLSACGAGESESPATQPTQAREAVPVELAAVRIEPLARTIEVYGQLYGDELATISAKVPGRVREIIADVGDRVAAAASLARIDPTDYELVVSQRELALAETLAKLGLDELPPKDFDVTKVATVERAAHEAQNAQAKLERARQLHEQDPPLISDQDFADTSTAHEVARSDYDVAILEAQSLLALARSRASELEAAQQRLYDSTVRAPGAPRLAATAPADSATQSASAEGVPRYAVIERIISQGEYVREGDPLYRVVADDPIKFRAGVSERFVPEVRTGQPVVLRVEGYEELFSGRVSRINPAIDPDSQTFDVEVLIENRDRKLKPGAFARAEIVVGEDPGVTFVPKSAVVSFAGVDRVFSVKDGAAIEHQVRLRETERDDYVGLMEPLENITEVVTTGSQRLADKVPVIVADQSSARVPMH